MYSMPEYILFCPNSGNTPLHIAVMLGHRGMCMIIVSCVELISRYNLLALFLSPQLFVASGEKEPQDEATILQVKLFSHTHTHAHTHTYSAIIDELLKHGALVKEKNNFGWTPLDEAISYGNKTTSEATLTRTTSPNYNFLLLTTSQMSATSVGCQ